jgi:predicted nuclease of predicted toxin-antitoxin system
MAWKRIFEDMTPCEFADFEKRFKSKARFLVDESLGIGAAKVIKDMGWNALYVAEVGLAGRSDEDVLAFAWKKDRILLTHDLDFLDDHKFPLHRNPGIVVLPGATGSAPGLVDALTNTLRLVGTYREAHRGDKIHITEEGIWTVKTFVKHAGVHRKKRFKFGRHDAVWEWTA